MLAFELRDRNCTGVLEFGGISGTIRAEGRSRHELKKSAWLAVVIVAIPVA